MDPNPWTHGVPLWSVEPRLLLKKVCEIGGSEVKFGPLECVVGNQSVLVGWLGILPFGHCTTWSLGFPDRPAK